MTDTTPRVTFVQLLERVKSGNHLPDFWAGIDDTRKLHMLEKAGFKDAPSMVKKPKRRANYLRIHMPALTFMLSSEEVARDVVLAWLAANSDLESPQQTEALDDDSSAHLLTVSVDSWKASGQWWKVALAFSTTMLLGEPDDHARHQISQMLDRFETGFPELLDTLRSEHASESKNVSLHPSLDRLMHEAERLWQLLDQLQAQRESPVALAKVPGMSELPALVAAVTEAYSSVQADLVRTSQSVELPRDVVPPAQCSTLEQLRSAYQAVQVALAERERTDSLRRLAEDRNRLADSLEPLTLLVRKDGRPMAELESVRAQARQMADSLRDAPLVPGSESTPELTTDSSKALVVLLNLVSGKLEDAEDSEVDHAFQTVADALGRPLAMAALRGLLEVAAEPSKANTAVPAADTADESPKRTPTEQAKAPSLEPSEVPATAVAVPSVKDGEPPSSGGLPTQTSPAESASAPNEPPPITAPSGPSSNTQPPAVSPAPHTDEGPTTAGEVDAHFWQMVETDLPAAYWLSRAYEAMEETAPVPSWLLAALQGARWLPDARDHVADDLAELALVHEVGPNKVHRLMATAASLVPALVSPNTGMSSWLHDAGVDAIYELVEAVRAFAAHGYGLRHEDLTGVVSKAQVNAEISDVVLRARAWLQDAPKRRMPYHRATEVWRVWTSQTGPLYQVVAQVATNDESTVDKALEAVKEWRRRPLTERVRRDDPYRKSQGSKPIISSSLVKLVNESEEAIAVVEEWAELQRRSRDLEERGDWFHEQVTLLVESVKATLPGCLAGLTSALANDAPVGECVALEEVLASVHEVAALLALGPQPSRRLPRLTGPLALPSPDLTGGLARALLCFPELQLADDGQPTPEAMKPLLQLLIDPDLSTADLRLLLRRWFESQDYRFIDQILEALGDQADLADLRRTAREAQRGSEDIVLERWNQVSGKLAQAVADEVLTPEERSECDGELQDVRGATGRYNYRVLHQRLSALENRVDRARQERLNAQQQEWKSVAERLPRSITDAATRTLIISAVDQSLERRDTVVVADLIAHLKASLDAGHLPDTSLFMSTRPTGDAFAEFVAGVPELSEMIGTRGLAKLANAIAAAGKAERRIGPLSFNLPAPRLKEARSALLAWSELTSLPVDGLVNPTPLAVVLRYLGFTISGECGEVVEQREHDRDWSHLTVRMSAADLSPIPAFGSLQDNRYSIVCQWERPSADVIGSMLRHLRLIGKSVVLLYFGRLTVNQRWQLAQQARKERLSMAVLDSNLLLYLSQERGSRLPVFLQCSLPFAVVNPYVPTGTVPREMFFGRQDMIQAIQSPSGPAMVFGGRQLGKSALLRRVQNEYDRPEREQFALYEDIKLIGDPTSRQPCEALWVRLADGLIRHGVLKSRGETPDKILAQIRDAMENHPGRRVLVLLDEADMFLKSDSDQGFTVVSELKRLMDDTQRRFKVVFAGLHNVQQYQGIPNQPLAHLDSLVVNPLEPRAARQLVEIPMRALGFRFSDQQAVPRVLAYTNYHPGLIQLFCHALVERLLRRPASPAADLEVRQSDVEDVYRSEEVQRALRERFEWTLALDARYQLVALALVHDQMAEHDGYGRAYSLSDVLSICRGWWRQGFEKVRLDQLQGVLDEMCGLGVLVRNTIDHTYRLRSPNLVRLMGSPEDIENALLALGDQQPAIEGVIGESHHAALDDCASIYSPFTYSQARTLNAKRFGVSLMFGSEALGLADAKLASQQFVAPEVLADKAGRWDELSFLARSGEAMRHALQKLLAQYLNVPRLVAYREMHGTSEQLAEQVNSAIEFCTKHARSQRQWLRVLLAFDPAATWEWLSVPVARRQELERSADALVWLRRWDEDGLKQITEQHGKRVNSRVLQRLLRETGGWPLLLRRLVAGWSSELDDPEEGLERLLSDLLEPSGAPPIQFWKSLGVMEVPLAEQVLRAIAVLGEPVEPGDLPSLMEGQVVPCEGECASLCEYLAQLGVLEESGTGLVVEPTVSRLLAAVGTA